ncbi:MAG: PAS domain S-box protein [Opitutales bacterium]
MWQDGRITWASISKVALRQKDHTIIGILGILRDVTEEHMSKEQLLKANKTQRLSPLCWYEECK